MVLNWKFPLVPVTHPLSTPHPTVPQIQTPNKQKITKNKLQNIYLKRFKAAGGRSSSSFDQNTKLLNSFANSALWSSVVVAVGRLLFWWLMLVLGNCPLMADAKPLIVPRLPGLTPMTLPLLADILVWLVLLLVLLLLLWKLLSLPLAVGLTPPPLLLLLLPTPLLGPFKGFRDFKMFCFSLYKKLRDTWHCKSMVLPVL